MNGTVVAPDASVKAYRLLARLFAEGPGGELRGYVAELPELAPLLGDSEDEDLAEHHRVLSMEVFPYAGVFLARDALFGGDEDHLAAQLERLAALTEAGDDAGAARFAAARVLPWLPAFAFAVARTGSRLYATLAELALGLVHQQRQRQGAATAVAQLADDDAWAGLLDDPKTGLKDIATVLLKPALSGVWLSRGDIGSVGRASRVPRGFGDRSTMLTNLLRSAAEHDALPQVVGAMNEVVEQWRAHWEAQGAHDWRARAAATEAALDRIAKAAT